MAVVHEVGAVDGIASLATELIDVLLDERCSLPLAEVAAITDQMAGAAAVRSRNFVHRTGARGQEQCPVTRRAQAAYGDLIAAGRGAVVASTRTRHSGRAAWERRAGDRAARAETARVKYSGRRD